MQKIDGFLAVLSIVGGSFSLQSQKLPFSVSSVDGDCSLLYFASIDLAGSRFPHARQYADVRASKIHADKVLILIIKFAP